MKILIPNASNSENVGDQAILFGLLSVLQSYAPNADIAIHAANPESYHGLLNILVKENLYSWAVFKKRGAVSRIIRCLELCFSFFCIKVSGRPVLVSKELQQLLYEYLHADLIVFNGGGYLRSQKGFTQSLNLFMQLWMFKFAALTKAKILVAPISFGPFAYSWQEKLSALVLKTSAQEILIREEISLARIAKYKMLKTKLSADLAFLLRPDKVKPKQFDRLTIGFTLRQWHPKKKQLEFEKNIAMVLIEIAQKYNAEIVPIVQVHSPQFGDADMEVTLRVLRTLKQAGVQACGIQLLKTIPEAFIAYRRVDVLLGMRMHSNILAAIQGTPFVAIAYEYKTRGLASMLGFDKYCVECAHIDARYLLSLLQEVIVNRTDLSHEVQIHLEKIRAHEHTIWKNILTEYKSSSASLLMLEPVL